VARVTETDGIDANSTLCDILEKYGERIMNHFDIYDALNDYEDILKEKGGLEVFEKGIKSTLVVDQAIRDQVERLEYEQAMVSSKIEDAFLDMRKRIEQLEAELREARSAPKNPPIWSGWSL
jgi:hypothetical protein